MAVSSHDKWILYFIIETCNMAQSNKRAIVTLVTSVINRTFLTHYMPLVSFYIPWRQQESSGFFMFSGCIERNQWHEMCITHFLWHQALLNSCTFYRIKYLGWISFLYIRPGQVARPIPIGRVRARKISETRSIFRGRTFCFVKTKNHYIYRFSVE